MVLPSTYYAGLRALGVLPLARRLREAGVILRYQNVWPWHNAAPTDHPPTPIALDRFADEMRWLARHYEIVPLCQLVRHLSAGRPLRGLAAVTFDDGYAGVFRYAWPLMLELGVPATIFVDAEAPGTGAAFPGNHPGAARNATSPPPSHRLADWDTIARGVDAGLTLGLRAATHHALTALDDAELERELLSSWEVIRARTGARAEFFAYPDGRWDARARDAVRAAGYRAAVTLDYGLVRVGADPWALPRINVPASLSRPAFEACAAGLSPRGTAPERAVAPGQVRGATGRCRSALTSSPTQRPIRP